MIKQLLSSRIKEPNITDSAKHDLALLLNMVAYGERIATDCASWQARVANDLRMKRFFRAQSRHERFHAMLFKGYAGWLSQTPLPPEHHISALNDYQQRLNQAMQTNNFLEVLVGQQLVLEGIGEVVLASLEEGMSQHDIGFSKLRKLIIRQEHAHNVFGIRQLEGALKAGITDPEKLTNLAMPYLKLAESLLDDCAPLLESVDIDASDYRDDLYSQLPAWIEQASITQNDRYSQIL